MMCLQNFFYLLTMQCCKALSGRDRKLYSQTKIQNKRKKKLDEQVIN
uniref:Uncharacterized protein n=1 Tax=Arundo donax TaxID=35708 RepID=A0A0A9E367_ARUDO